MARTIQNIKDEMTTNFMANETMAKAFGFNVGDRFTTYFGRVSFVGVIFFVTASAIWVLESLFDAYKAELNDRLDRLATHNPKWYRNRALLFMKDKLLPEDSVDYDTSGMTDEDIEAARVVKHAVAVENGDRSVLTIKIRGEEGELDLETKEQVQKYLWEIKDAGVKLNIVNEPADLFRCSLDIYYNPLLLPDTVEESCREAIVNYLRNLPFNGEYTNMALVDVLQAVEGVKVVKLCYAASAPAGTDTYEDIDVRVTPIAGYFKEDTIELNMEAYEQV